MEVILDVCLLGLSSFSNIILHFRKLSLNNAYTCKTDGKFKEKI